MTNTADHYRRSTCRLCGSADVELAVPITPTPVADAFVTREQLDEPQACYPLDMYQCRACGHVQLLDVVNPEVLFAHYSYFSGRSPGLVRHFAEYAHDLLAYDEVPPDSLVVDVGSNDGAFLKLFADRGLRVLGVDPAENIAAAANDSGIETWPAFFDDDLALRIRTKRGPARLVTANNVFAHTDAMGEMADAVRILLADDGLFAFEVSYLLDVIDHMLLGTIFHEHLCYHSVRPLQAFLQRHGLELVRVRRVSVQGGSLIGFAQPIGGPRPVDPSVGELLELEEQRRLHEPETLAAFAQRLEDYRREVGPLLHGLHDQGRTIAGFGAARGGTLLIYHFDLGDILSFIVDDSPEKQSLYSPGCHIPVLPTSELYERRPDDLFILAWVHSKPIMRNHVGYLQQGGRFITFFPEVQIIEREEQLPP